MAGRKQHFIPQSLLRGFLTTEGTKSDQVWVFPVTGAPYLANIKDVAAARHFYSPPSVDGRSSLDDAITEYENFLGVRLSTLRRAAHMEEVDAFLASEVIAHLAIRSAFIRDVFKAGLGGAIDRVEALTTDQEWTRRYLGIDTGSPSDVLMEEVHRLFDQARPSLPVDIPSHLVERLCLVLLRERFEPLHTSTIAELPQAWSLMRDSVIETTDRAHRSALTGSLVPRERVEKLARLKWYVIDINDAETVLLPDCVVIARTSADEESPTAFLLEADVHEVFMPITSTRVLVGCVSPPTPIDVAWLNGASFSMSMRFVVGATKRDDVLRAFAKWQGSTRSHVHALIDEAVSSIAQEGTEDPHASPQVNEHSAYERATSHAFQMSFIDCGDEATAKRIAGTVQTLIDAVSKSVSLARIERITFSGSYDQTCAEIDLGYASRRELSTTRRRYGSGVGRNLLVLRDQQVKCSIVIASEIAHALLSEELAEEFWIAAHTITKLLAQAAFTHLFDTAVPNVLLKPIKDPWIRLLYPVVSGVCSSYYAARLAAGVHPDAKDAFFELAESSFDHMIEDVARARQAYFATSDLDQLVQSVTPCIGDFLDHLAALLGHLDQADEQLASVEQLSKILEQRQLLEWIAVFHRDLRRLFDRRGTWKGFDEFTFLTIHTERLLYMFGIFPWKDDLGEVRVSVMEST